MVSATTNKTGWFTIIGTVRGCSSNTVTFKPELERVTRMWQGVWRRGIQRDERSDTKKLNAIVLKGSTVYQTPVIDTFRAYIPSPVSPEQ